MALFIWLMEREFLPDWLIRLGIRSLCRKRLRHLEREAVTAEFSPTAFAEDLKRAPLAEHTGAANEQHYEVPAEFFLAVLGPNRKYSCAFFHDDADSLEQAETAALKETVAHAEIQDGMQILELGCGWGSLTLYLAKTFPESRILGVSNSRSQRELILSLAKNLGLSNVEVLTADLSTPSGLAQIPTGQFDRIVSVEMFEHFKNYEWLLKQCAQWLKPTGKLFVHIFTHAKFSYPFETEGEDNWMGRYFFTGGQMPARDLLSQFQEDLILERQWEWSGHHYQKTANAWLANLDAHRTHLQSLLKTVYGSDGPLWIARWRVFFMAVAELFGYQNGKEWGVTHYLFTAANKSRVSGTTNQ